MHLVSLFRRHIVPRVTPKAGRSAEVEIIVTEDDTAVALGSGSVTVLGTPRVVALCEQAAVAALDPELDDGFISVGFRIQLDHLRPTLVGTKIWATATIERVEKRRITFTVTAEDKRGLIAAGKITRAIVRTERFLDNAT